MSTQLKAQQGLTNLTPIKVIHILISLAIMVCFKFVPAAEPLTPLGVEVIGIFLGMLYGWLIANDSFWPSIFGLLFLGLSSYSTVPAVLRDGFGNSTVLLLFFFFAFTNIISAAGITEYIARWIVSRKVVQGRPYLLTLMIFLAMCALVIMVSCAAATMVIFPLIKEICRLYGVKPGSKWASITLVGTICVGCSFYMLLPFKSLPAVVFSSYTQMSGGDSIALVPYLAIVVVITAITMALLLVLMKFVLRCDVSVIASSNKSMEELPKLSRYQKFIMVFFVTVIVLLLFPSFVPKTFIVSTVLNNGRHRHPAGRCRRLYHGQSEGGHACRPTVLQEYWLVHHLHPGRRAEYRRCHGRRVHRNLGLAGGADHAGGPGQEPSRPHRSNVCRGYGPHQRG